MSFTLETPTADALAEAVEDVARWQRDGSPVQLHPGDLGWNWSFGTAQLAASVRVWRRDGEVVAVGMVEDPGLIRLAIAPSVDADEAFARQLLADVSDPARGVLPAGTPTVEARAGSSFRHLLARSGWLPDEPWTPLTWDLTDPVTYAGLRVEVVEKNLAAERVAVQRAAFPSSTFTLDRWQAMAASPPYRRGRCLLGYDDSGTPVAATTVWSAGPGRPGLIEPLGVHRDHRGHGYGRAITRAAAAALRELGSSSVRVCTPAANVGGVAAYVAAGFEQLPDVTDFRSPAQGGGTTVS